MRRALPILGLWCTLSVVLAVVTTRVGDWYAMPNELLYERRAISVAHQLSLLPRLRGELVATFDQLYPVLIAPAFRWGSVPDSLFAAHALNAWIMASACIPAYLLARRVTAPPWIPWAVAVLSVAMPWILFASLLLTEVAAYPAFVWAILAMQACVAAPSRRHDVLAVGAIAVAFLGRTQMALLGLVLPAAILAFELGRTGSARRALRDAVVRHRVLAWVSVVCALAALGLAPAGKLPEVLGVYGATIGGTGSSIAETFAPSGVAGSFVEHIATFSLGMGILPFVVGCAWLLANLVRPPRDGELHAFACLGALVAAALLAEVTIFDLRFGDSFVHDRYLFYLVPLLVLAFLCALAEPARLRWSLVVPAALVVLGFCVGAIPAFTWQQFVTMNPDGPIAVLYRPLVQLAGSLTSARVLLAVATVALTALYVVGARLVSRRSFTAISTAFALVILPALTVYMFHNLFDHDGWSGRPVTATPGYGWVDGIVGGRARVAMAPYPTSSAYLVNQREWRDYEFWNASVEREVQQVDGSFIYTNDTFPRLYPRFDPESGRADVSPAPYVLQSNQETRFRIAGTVRANPEGVMLIQAAMPWRADWLARGLYPDGWTKPGAAARVRVFAVPGQRGAVTRGLSLRFQAPEDVERRAVHIASNLERTSGDVSRAETLHANVRVCVPAGGYADVAVGADGTSALPPDLRFAYETAPRRGGVLVTEIALADEIGARCTAGGRLPR